MNKARIITENITDSEPYAAHSDANNKAPVNANAAAGDTWQIQLRDAITEPLALCQSLSLSPERAGLDEAPDFAVMVPQQFVNKMQLGNPNDPLLLQVLPRAQERLDAQGFVADPLEETALDTPAGLLQKYHGRVLLILAGKCAINCRYCFRRHYPYEDARISADAWQNILDYIAADDSIHEVIFSGGEPLLVSDTKLAHYIRDLESIAHVTTLRFHTRLPIVIPERLTPSLCQLLQGSRLQSVIVLHSNHPNEIDDNLAQHLAPFRAAGVTCLNQSVLLADVNDCSETLTRLSKKLFAIGVLPYYLHTLDEVSGAQHFQVPITRAKRIHRELKAGLSGYLVPKLVTETPHEPNKVTLS